MFSLLFIFATLLASDPDPRPAPSVESAPSDAPEKVALSALSWDFAYTANNGGIGGIWLYSRGQRRLLTAQFSLADHAAWSPDGRRIAFAGKVKNNWDIYVLTLDS